ncbi:MAG: DUF4358 domain-containing protein [Oscillospiraceae bacterium]
MKKIALFLCAVVITIGLASCSQQVADVPTSEIMSQVRSQIELPEMGDIKKEAIAAYMDLKPEDMTEMSYIISGSGITADELFVAKAADKAGAEKIKAAAEKRKTKQHKEFESYNPDEVPKLEKAYIGIKGNYVIFAVTNDSSKVSSLFDKALTKNAK